MEQEKIIQSIVEKCDFVYDDVVLSKETIIRQYLSFFARQFNPDEKTVSFVFHTGSRCFDIVSLAALLIGCLAYEFSSNDEILSGLEPQKDMVIFNNKRYLWGGFETVQANGKKIKQIVISQEMQDKYGKHLSTTRMPYDTNKHAIRPYYGNSKITDGRGIKKCNSNRDDFISFVLDIPIKDVPITLDISAVVVADRQEIVDLCKRLKIKYGEGKYVDLTDVIPVSYYTSSGEEFQIGRNVAKSEAVIKVASRISTARDLILTKDGNRVIGLLVSNTSSYTETEAELNDLLRRKSLKFAYVLSPYDANSCDLAIEKNENAALFACTKEYVSQWQHSVINDSKITQELARQIANIINKKLTVIPIEGTVSWERFKRVKDQLYIIKQSNWDGDNKDNFILSSMALLNLFATSFFSMKKLEEMIKIGAINISVVSPWQRILELEDIWKRTLSMKEQCGIVVFELKDMYNSLFEKSPKEDCLLSLLDEKRGYKIAVVVPKAYYSVFLDKLCQESDGMIICTTANRFDKNDNYDYIIAVGDIIGKRFDALDCFAAEDIYVLTYEFENKLFSHRKKMLLTAEHRVNARIKGLKGEVYLKENESDDILEDFDEKTVCQFSDLDEYVESLRTFDIKRLSFLNNSNSGTNTTSEVEYVGAFTTGEQILFSKYYSAVVFDPGAGEVTEKSPDKLAPGDILVFTKRNDYTSNIVDQIFDQLVSKNKLSEQVLTAAAKAVYWKDCLKKYKAIHDLSYRALAKELKRLGCQLQEVTIRQWLVDESHIIGPQSVESIRLIGELTQDSYLLTDYKDCFEACGIIRHYRREILSLIARAINDKLSNKEPTPGSEFEIVFENVGKLSDIMELENVLELEETMVVNNGLVNRPISETEVLM